MTNAKEKYEKAEFGGALSPCFRHIYPYISESRVLDIASGDGTYLKHFGKKSVGLDISDPNLEFCKNKSLWVVKGDLNTTFPIKSNSFDAVFCSNILEHVDSPIFMLREIHRVLKKEGKLILCVPNEDSIIHWFYDYFETNGRHLYSFSINNLHALSRESHFKIEQIFGDFHSVVSRKLKLTPLLEILHIFPLRLVNRLSHFYWIVAIKKS